METRPPSIGKILTMVLFALSVAGLLLYLWLSFGGTLPFAAQGYRFQVAFPNAQQLAAQADVRIAGVSVGKVVAKTLDPQGNRTLATIELDPQYAPVRVDTHAILREKTLLGETYVELDPGSPRFRPLADGGTLARANVEPTVQLSDIFDAFDPVTRRDFQTWQEQLSRAVAGNDQNLSSVLGNLPTFAADSTTLLGVLEVEQNAVVTLFSNGSTVFSALSSNQAALHGLVSNGEATLATTAANSNALADTVHVLPTFENETKATLAKLQTFSQNTDPLVHELYPVAQQLGPTLRSVADLSPDLRHLFANLNPLITVSETGLPALRDVLNGATPLLGSLGPFLEQLNPILTWLSLHQQLTSDFISQGASALAAKTTVFGGNGVTCQGVPCGHYLRQFAPVGAAEPNAYYTHRASGNRGNTYPPPLWLSDPNAFSAGGKFPNSFTLPAWDCTNAGGPKAATPTPAHDNDQACWAAPPLGQLLGQPQSFPHITAATYSGG